MATSTVPDPAHVFSIISAICDATILLVFPVRLWKLRGSAIKNALSWHGPFKAVSIALTWTFSAMSHTITELNAGSWNTARHRIIFELDRAPRLGCPAAKDSVFGLIVRFYTCCIVSEPAPIPGATTVRQSF